MADTSIEYSMICIDNSDYMRNEDIRPNRFLSEKDATNMICHHILSSRVENRVGLVTLANKPQVIQTLTNNEINVMRRLYAIEMIGEISLITAINISILCFKNISSKGLVTANKKQRIIAFVGSPFKEDQKQFDSLVTKLNKMKISVDIISFGSENANKIHILKSFVSKLKNSNLVIIPNNRVISNVLSESPILSNSRNVALVNENMDPELSLAMKMSVNEQKNQMDIDMKKAMNESTKSSDVSSSDEELQKAIEMSLNFFKENNIPIKEINTQTKKNTESKGLTDEEQLALSLQMSLLDSKNQSKHSSDEKKEPKMDSKKNNNKKQ